MSYKVVRNASGEIVAFGPDDIGYDPGIPSGCTIGIEEALPAPNAKQIAASQIQLLEVKTLLPRVAREFILDALKTEALKIDLDPMALPAYVKLKAIDDQIMALRAQL